MAKETFDNLDDALDYVGSASFARYIEQDLLDHQGEDGKFIGAVLFCTDKFETWKFIFQDQDTRSFTIRHYFDSVRWRKSDVNIVSFEEFEIMRWGAKC
jgi:hypothetical protein